MMNRLRLTQIEDYEPLVGGETIDRIRKKARSTRLSSLVGHISNIDFAGIS